MAEAKVDALVISDPHNLAWAFNLRGGDVGHTPLPLGYAILPAGGPGEPVLRPGEVTNEARRRRGRSRRLRADQRPSRARSTSSAGQAARSASTRPPAPSRLIRRIEAAGGKVDVGADPIALMKAVKNEAEIAGSRAAHLRDGVAVARFLAWLDREAPDGKLTEIDAVEALEAFRRRDRRLKDVSFPSISGAGPNAALPHYRVTRSSNRAIEPNQIFLIDSGAQYEDGTTDITRTIVVGEPTAEMKDRFTRVLKGHIAIAQSRVPERHDRRADRRLRPQAPLGGRPRFRSRHRPRHRQLSLRARRPAAHRQDRPTPLEAGMMLSNEPGFYKPGAYGIRIENLILVEKRDDPRAATAR